MTYRLLAVGEAMAELRFPERGSIETSFAGDTYNTAVYCHRALNDGPVGYMTRVGRDPLSDAFVATAEKEGLDMTHVARDDARQIGIYSVATDGSGERSFHYWREKSAARQMFSGDDPAAFPNAEIIYLSAITLAILNETGRDRLIHQLDAAKRASSAQIAFDSNYRPALWENVRAARDLITRMWELADVALPSIDDEMHLFGEDEETVMSRFADGSFAACAIKRGMRGPFSPSLAPDRHPEFNPSDLVIDTTAAGDSFNGAYLAAYIRGCDEDVRLVRAHDVARHVIGHSGAIVPRD